MSGGKSPELLLRDRSMGAEAASGGGTGAPLRDAVGAGDAGTAGEKVAIVVGDGELVIAGVFSASVGAPVGDVTRSSPPPHAAAAAIAVA